MGARDEEEAAKDPHSELNKPSEGEAWTANMPDPIINGAALAQKKSVSLAQQEEDSDDSDDDSEDSADEEACDCNCDEADDDDAEDDEDEDEPEETEVAQKKSTHTAPPANH